MIEEDSVPKFTRTYALEVGDLVDIPCALADEAGIKYPSAISFSLQNRLVPTVKEVESGQSLEGRILEMLRSFRVLAQSSRNRFLLFSLTIKSGKDAEDVGIAVTCGPDDFGRPCLTFNLAGDF